MAFQGFSTVRRRTMPFLGILQADLNKLIRSWVVRIWAGLLAVFVVVTLVGSAGGTFAAESLANLLGSFPLLWSTLVIVVSAGSVSSEAGVVADSILSKAVTRYEYILAKLFAPLIVVLGLYLLAIALPLYVVARGALPVEELDSAGLAWGVGLVAAILFTLTALSVAFSALFNRTLVAVIVVLILWYGAGIGLAALGAEILSPVFIVEQLPAIIQGDYESGELWRTLAGFGIIASVLIVTAGAHFSAKDL